MEVEPKIDIVTIPPSILQVFQTWCCQGGTLGWSSTVELHFLQHRVSELMHSYTSDPSPSPLHLVVVKVPRRQIQCSSYYHQLFNFFVNVGMVWCLMSYPWYVHLHEIRSFDVWFRYQKVWYGRGRWRTPMWTEMFPSLIFLYNRFHSNSSGDSVWESP